MSNEIMEITINENETIMALLNRMLNIKKESAKDIQCQLNGRILTTVNCANIEEAFIKNAQIILEEYQKDRVALLSTEEMQKALKLASIDVLIFESNPEIEKNKIEFQNQISKLDSLNFGQPALVLSWLNSIIPYVNDFDLLPLNEKKKIVSSIVQKLAENGYQEAPAAINNMDDYRKYMIVSQLQDLNQYGFFAYDYADSLRDCGIIHTETLNQEANVYNLTVDSNAKVFDTLLEMWDLRQKNNQDIRCELNGYILTTANCADFQDVQAKNSDAIFDEYEKDKALLLETEKMNEVVETFKNRGHHQKAADSFSQNLTQLEIEFQTKMEEFENLNFKNPSHVLNWLNSAIPYMNNPDLFLMSWMNAGVTENNITDYIVKKLESNGYLAEKQPINNSIDFAKRLICYELQDLKNYGFFAYEYADNLRNNNLLEEINSNSNAVSEEVKVYDLGTKDNTKVIDTFIEMWSIKKNNNQEVICTRNGIEYSTLECNSLTELYTKYHNAFFEEYDKEMEKLLTSATIQNAIYKFSEENIQNHLSEIEQQANNEMDSKCTELQNMDIDFTNPVEVNGWLRELAKYINEPSVNVVVVDNQTFTYRSNQILIKLKENGYGDKPEQINNVADFNRRIIADRMEQLEKYHFFTKEYFDKNYDKNEQVIKSIDSEVNQAQLQQNLDAKEKKLQLIAKEFDNNSQKIALLNRYRAGKINEKGQLIEPLLNVQKRNANRILELEEQKHIPINFKNSYVSSSIELEKLTSGMGVSMLEDIKNATATAYDVPDTNRMIKALEEAMKLPEEVGLKNAYFDVITKQDLYLNEKRYQEFSIAEADIEMKELMEQSRTEEEKKVYAQYNSMVNLPSNEAILSVLESTLLLPKTSTIREPLVEMIQYRKKEFMESNIEVIKEILALSTENYKISNELEQRRVNTEKNLQELTEKNQDLAEEYCQILNDDNFVISEEVENQLIEDSNNDLAPLSVAENVSNAEDEEDIEVTLNEDSIGNDLDEVAIEINPNYMENSVSNEQVTVNTNPIKTDNSNYLEKLHSIDQISNDIERKLTKENSWMEENTARNLGKLQEGAAIDTRPHRIVETKKASNSLIQKVRDSKFVEKIKHAVDTMKKNKEAFIFAGLLLATAIAGTINDKLNDKLDSITTDTNIETESNIDTNMNLEEQIEDTVNDIVQPTVQEDKVSLQEETEKVNTINTMAFADNIELVKQDILNGAPVYTTVGNALNNQDDKHPTVNQREQYWQNTEPGTYYTKEEGVLQKLSPEEAQTAWENGNQVVVGMENKGTTIGYVPVEQQDTAKTM